MAIFDIFKKKKEKKEKTIKTPRKVRPKKEIVKPVEKKEGEKPKKETVLEKRPPRQREKKVEKAWQVLKSVHVTEKATDLAKNNQYVFKVFPRANKTEIKKAVEGLYGVDVVSVKIINVLPKRRRLGRIEGSKSGYRKAIVRIKEGHKIEVLPR